MSNYKRYTFEEVFEYNNPTGFNDLNISWYTRTVNESGNSRNRLFNSNTAFVAYIECEEKEIGSGKFNSNIFKLKAWVILIDKQRKVIYGEYKKVTSDDEKNYSFNPIISIGELISGWDSEDNYIIEISYRDAFNNFLLAFPDLEMNLGDRKTGVIDVTTSSENT